MNNIDKIQEVERDLAAYKKICEFLMKELNDRNEHINLPREYTNLLKIIQEQENIINHFTDQYHTYQITLKKIQGYAQKIMLNERLNATCTGICENKEINTSLSCWGCIAIKIYKLCEQIDVKW